MTVKHICNAKLKKAVRRECALAGTAFIFSLSVYSSSRNTRDFSGGIHAQKGNSLHRGYNPAMKNKRSDTPKVCWMQHGSGSTCFACGEDVDMSLRNKTCQPASGAQDSRASLEYLWGVRQAARCNGIIIFGYFPEIIFVLILFS